MNQSFATATMTFAVPASMAPLPLTFLAFGAFLVESSAYQTGAIFVAMIAAHATTTGLGVLHRMTGAPTIGSWHDSVPSLRDPLEYDQQRDAEGAQADPHLGQPELRSVAAARTGSSSCFRRRHRTAVVADDVAARKGATTASTRSDDSACEPLLIKTPLDTTSGATALQLAGDQRVQQTALLLASGILPPGSPPPTGATPNPTALLQ